ncbi:MAG TPA: tetratricopeptide repeat protein, partial [Thermoanaerobaculia bacterium]|nr:tetratricopeptide repeat protein [Thermoanaerobaculia bacterium]
YRIRKFLRRHRAAAAIAAVALLVAASWPVVSRWRAREVRGGELAVFHEVEPGDPETRRWLRDGAERLARLDGAGARESFRRAASSSKDRLPGAALAWDGVARAEGSLGEVGRAAEAAKRAGALIERDADTLPRHEAERLRARALAAKLDWNGAVAAFEAIFSAQPERIDVGLDLVRTLLLCGRTDAADTALGRLRQLAPPRGDPRIDLLEAEVALQLTEYQRAAAAASRARTSAATLQAVAMSQRAARVHAEAVGRLDRREEARRELEAVAIRNEALGMPAEAAAARVALGTVLIRTASSDEARRTLAAGLAGCIQAGNQRCAISARAQLAIVDGKSGKLNEALRGAEGAHAEARAIGDRWIEGYVLSQRLTLSNWADDAAAVKALAEPAIAALRDSGNRHLLLATLTNLAIAAIEDLELEKAEAYIVECDGLARHVGSQLAGAAIDRARGYLEQTRGDYDLARERYTAALEKARRAGVPMSVANYLNDLAWLELAADRPGPAAERAREAIAALNATGDKRTAVSTEAVLAWAEARQGNAEAARQRLAVLRKAAAEDGSAYARFDLLTVEARVAAAMGDWPRAVELRRETVRMASEWNAQGLVIMQQTHLAKALHGAGERRALEQLAAEILPKMEQHGLRGIDREVRALLATPAGKR